jgi:superfamily I DNA and/or RNA helicase
MRAANVVFATTNSADLERLIEERAQFDWSVVEEAGKATGSELISPLLLSHRRLMIGDHYQLPPFGSEQIMKLLENHEAVRNALLVGDEFIGRSLRDETTEEILDELEDDENDLPAMCADAMRMLTLFETMIEAEFKRQATGRRGRPIAKKLTRQHRMHPSIAALVSRCFYSEELETDTDSARRFRTEAPPFATVDAVRAPISPIVLVDMPYVQDTVGQKIGDSLPRWINEQEIDAVIEVLKHLRATKQPKDSPSLAVLSPYSQQVRRLAQALSARMGTDLSHLGDFDTALKASNFCGTVDSFQGSEADLVVVSLVRNNHHANIRAALGFLSDFRRMNVLLSRARWQLVLVASRNFLRTVVEAAKGKEEEQEIKFLKTMLDVLVEGEREGSVQLAHLDGFGGAE